MQAATNIIPFPSRVRPRSSKDTGTPVSPGDTGTAVSPSARKAPGSVTTAAPEEIVFQTPLVTEEGQYEPSRSRLSQSELYPVRQAFAIEHITALRLLTLAIGRSQRALAAIAGDDLMAADTEMQKIQVLRTLGDGFGTVINAVICAFESLAGNTPDVSQIRTLNRIFELLKDKPFLSTDEADGQLEKLEAIGLNPYPTELLEFLSSDESIR